MMGIKNALSIVGAVSIVIIVTLSVIFLSVESYMHDYVLADLLSSAKSVASLESDREEQKWDKQHVEFFEKLTGATVMYMDTTIMYSHSDYRSDVETSREIIKFDVMDPAAEEGNVERIYILDSLEQYDFQKILEGDYFADIRSFTFSEEALIVAGAPIYDSHGKVTAGVVLVQNTDVIDSQMDRLGGVMLAVGAISIFFTALGTFLNSRRLVEPIQQITIGTRRLAEGQYGEMINSRNTGTELDALVGTLNTLSWRLKDVFDSLNQEHDKHELVLNSLNEGIIGVDWYMNVLHCNNPFLEMAEINSAPEKLDLTTVTGKTLFDSMRTKERVNGRWQTENGRSILIMASPLYGNGRMVIGSVGIVVDVSESERMEQIRRDYVANISHELRTPLTGIRGMVEPLMDGIFETEEERQDCYSVIYQETLRLEKLIQDMLDMSRLQDGRLTIETEPLIVDEILAFAMRRVSKTAADSGIELSLKLEGENIECIGNEDRILQVITIFLDNAVNFTPPGGKITITAQNRENDVLVSVRDTGCGIEPKDLPYIWERFYKTDKSRMRTPGTGLGLAIAKLIIELMDGEIGVHSQPGKGAEFWFTLKK